MDKDISNENLLDVISLYCLYFDIKKGTIVFFNIIIRLNLKMVKKIVRDFYIIQYHQEYKRKN